MTSNAGKDLPISTPRALADHFQQAFRLLSGPRPQHAIALPLLVDCVAGDPGNLIFVETFLHVLSRVAPSPGRLRGLVARFAFQRAVDRQDWHRVLRQGPPLLALRPNDAHVLSGMAEACDRLRHGDVAVRYALGAVEKLPEDLAVQRRGAACLARHGLFDQAAECWRRVLALIPNDDASRRALACLGRSVPDRSDAEPASGPVTGRDLTDTAAIVRDADALTEGGDLSGAQSLLFAAQQANPGDLRLRERLEDLQVTQAQSRLEIARRQDAATPDADTQELVRQLEGDLLRRQIDVYGARAGRYPHEHGWKLQLARCLTRSGNFAESRQILQQIPTTSPLFAQAALATGECLQYQQCFDQALASYKTAVHHADERGSEESTHRQALYRAGVLAMEMGYLDQAHEYLRRLAKIAPTHEDIAQRLDKLEQIRNKE